VISLRGLTTLLDAKAVHPRRSALARTPVAIIGRFATSCG
jgi:hypothetical protein